MTPGTNESGSPTVSVVMATYNGERFLRAQLASILQCLQPGDELIVVDDCSTDKTLAVLAEVRWPGFALIRNPRNQGVRASFERGLQQAKGEVVFLSDQDDVWVRGKRDAFVAEFKGDPLCSVVISDASIIDAEGTVIAASYMQARGGFRGDPLSTFARNRYMGCAMAVRSSLLGVALPIPITTPLHDVYLGLIGSLTGTIHYLEQPYLMHRRHGANTSPSSRRGWGQVIQWRVGLLRALADAVSRAAVRRSMRNFRRARNRGRSPISGK